MFIGAAAGPLFTCIHYFYPPLKCRVFDFVLLAVGANALLVAGVNSLPIFGAAWASVKSKEQDDDLLYSGGIFVGGGGGVQCPLLTLCYFCCYSTIALIYNHLSTIATYRSST